jgi:hypothetical protein
VAQAGRDVAQTAAQNTKEEGPRYQGQPIAQRAANVIGRGAEAAAQQMQGRFDHGEYPD